MIYELRSIIRSKDFLFWCQINFPRSYKSQQIVKILLSYFLVNIAKLFVKNHL
jgi:hypothetical protein